MIKKLFLNASFEGDIYQDNPMLEQEVGYLALNCLEAASRLFEENKGLEAYNLYLTAKLSEANYGYGSDLIRYFLEDEDYGAIIQLESLVCPICERKRKEREERKVFHIKEKLFEVSLHKKDKSHKELTPDKRKRRVFYNAMRREISKEDISKRRR